MDMDVHVYTILQSHQSSDVARAKLNLHKRSRLSSACPTPAPPPSYPGPFLALRLLVWPRAFHCPSLQCPLSHGSTLCADVHAMLHLASCVPVHHAYAHDELRPWRRQAGLRRRWTLPAFDTRAAAAPLCYPPLHSDGVPSLKSFRRPFPPPSPSIAFPNPTSRRAVYLRVRLLRSLASSCQMPCSDRLSWHAGLLQ